MAKSIIYSSQIDLPFAADHAKSPIRKQEFDSHVDSEIHIQNNGVNGQMLVMTAVGPRMMTPKVTCSCGGGHYGCESRVVFDNTAPKPLNIVCTKVFRGVTYPVTNEGTSENPTWTLEYEDVSTYFEFDPVSVYDCDPMYVDWTLANTPAGNMTTLENRSAVDGRNRLRVWYNMLGVTPFDITLRVGIGRLVSPNMLLRIKKIP